MRIWSVIVVVMFGVTVHASQKIVAAGSEAQVKKGDATATSKTSSLENLLQSMAIDSSEQSERAERALEKVTSFDLKNVALCDVVEQLRQSSDANFVIDEAALKSANVEVTDHVSLIARKVQVRSALRLMLDPMGLAFVIEDGVVRITSKESACQSIKSRIYPIADLAIIPMGNSFTDVSQDIIDLITRTIDPDSWEDNGGDGRIEAFLPVFSLVVTQSDATHGKIVDFLHTIRISKERASALVKQSDKRSLAEVYHETVKQQLKEAEAQAEKEQQKKRERLLKEQTKKGTGRETSGEESTPLDEAGKKRLEEALADASEARRVAARALDSALRLQQEVEKLRAARQQGK